MAKLLKRKLDNVQGVLKYGLDSKREYSYLLNKLLSRIESDYALVKYAEALSWKKGFKITIAEDSVELNEDGTFSTIEEYKLLFTGAPIVKLMYYLSHQGLASATEGWLVGTRETNHGGVYGYLWFKVPPITKEEDEYDTLSAPSSYSSTMVEVCLRRERVKHMWNKYTSESGKVINDATVRRDEFTEDAMAFMGLVGVISGEKGVGTIDELAEQCRCLVMRRDVRCNRAVLAEAAAQKLRGYFL